MALHQFVLFAYAALLCWAAVGDVRSYRIPNGITAAIAALYPAHVALSPAPVAWAGACAGAAIVFAVGALLFAWGRLGGGDVKLLSAVSLWAGMAHLLDLLLLTALVGGALALFALGWRRHVGPAWEFALVRFGLGLLGPTASGPAAGATTSAQAIPYGVAIAVGGLAVTWMSVAS